MTRIIRNVKIILTYALQALPIIQDACRLGCTATHYSCVSGRIEGVPGLGFRVQGLGFRVWELRLRAQGPGSRAAGSQTTFRTAISKST